MSDELDIDEIRSVADRCKSTTHSDLDYLLQDAADALNSAADEVERLREENADLRKALRDIADE